MGETSKPSLPIFILKTLAQAIKLEVKLSLLSTPAKSFHFSIVAILATTA
jgi:hypothetical protein